METARGSVWRDGDSDGADFWSRRSAIYGISETLTQTFTMLAQANSTH
ncbi:MAG: hypothetical protein MPL62_02630 [Alphaproteobacteria bacterium]|nr:hypothetical protein [Alphaproteobacteria bacterium]